MPHRGRTHLGRHRPFQRHCRRMRVNVPPPNQAGVPAPVENRMFHREPLQSLPQAFKYNNEVVQNVFVVGTLPAQCIHCIATKCLNKYVWNVLQ